jgi:hypothetical protein
MRSKRRAVFAAALAVVALGVTGVASASAAEWYVAGSPLTGSAALASNTSTSESIVLSFSGANIRCSGLELKTASIAAKTGGQIEHLLLTGCEFTNLSCRLKSSTIETKQLTMEAALGAKSPEDKVLLKPKTETLIAEFKLGEGEKCPWSGSTFKLTGHMTFVVSKGREERVEQEVALRSEGELFASGSEAHLSGTVGLKLASAKNWSFH